MTQVKWSVASLIALFFSALVVGAAWLIIQKDLKYSAYEVARIKGDSLFHLIQTTRRWSSMHGGVYVPVTPDTQPNPYLHLPDRDITDTTGRLLTKINPAYMTRQISDLLKGSDVEARLTSLRPLNPINVADQWETESLHVFGSGQKKSIVVLDHGTFRYIAPLTVEESCLKCHSQQGYKLGDVRGGVSINFPALQIESVVERLAKRSEGVYWIAFMAIFVLSMGLFAAINVFSGKLAASAENERELVYKANHDGLTGVLNHRAIMEQADYEFKRSLRQNRPLSVLMLDVDFFKKINDTYGHLVGDEVLISVADQIGIHLREVDFLGRYGGEEFIVLLPDVGEKTACIIAERIRSAIDEGIVTAVVESVEQLIDVKISIGVSERAAGMTDLSELINCADQALYYAKSQGRNRVEVFDSISQEL